ncbi:MAG: hypothetical protein AUI15_08540 [Actinobacteria bacterium 13_2_20CM_2_66_6]|nr:MAG: hypothetical protein AUI15_08540 [Actinobacteria bacterium 13_2_20CM_2_66_6]
MHGEAEAEAQQRDGDGADDAIGQGGTAADGQQVDGRHLRRRLARGDVAGPDPGFGYATQSFAPFFSAAIAAGALRSSSDRRAAKSRTTSNGSDPTDCTPSKPAGALISRTR